MCWVLSGPFQFRTGVSHGQALFCGPDLAYSRFYSFISTFIYMLSVSLHGHSGLQSWKYLWPFRENVCWLLIWKIKNFNSAEKFFYLIFKVFFLNFCVLSGTFVDVEPPEVAHNTDFFLSTFPSQFLFFCLEQSFNFISQPFYEIFIAALILLTSA